MLFAVLVLLGVATLVYLWLSQHYSYWSRQGVVQPSTLPLCGNMLPVLLNKTGIGQLYDQIYRSYPDRDAVGVYSLLNPTLLIRSPQLVQRVLISDFSSFHDNEFTVNEKLEPVFAKDPFCIKGVEWKHSRSRLSSMVTSSRIREVFPMMRDLVPRVDTFLNQRFGKDIDAKELTGLFTMEVVSDCVFGISSNCFEDPQTVFRRMSDQQKVEVMQSWWKNVVFQLMPRVRNIMGLRFIPVSVTDFVKNIVEDVSKHRRAEKVRRNDLFNYCMNRAEDAEDPLTEMFSVCLSFFIEGFDTAALASSRVLYELALNPGVQQTLHDELRGAFGDQFHPDYETLAKLPYLDQVICEAQRKYPVLMTFTRVCTRPAELQVDGRSLRIEPGTPVVIPAFSIHRDARYFPDPDKFDPDRFSRSNVEARPDCTFMPFGEGPRICPGLKFGLVQVKLLVSNVVFKYEVMKCKRTPETLTFAKGSFLIVPNEKLWIQIRKRKQ